MYNISINNCAKILGDDAMPYDVAFNTGGPPSPDRTFTCVEESLRALKLSEKPKSARDIVINDLNDAVRFLCSSYPSMNQIYESYHRPYQFKLETNLDKPFGACYTWGGGNSIIKMCTPEDPKSFQSKDVNTLNLGLSEEHILSRRVIHWDVLTHEDMHNVFVGALEKKTPQLSKNETIHAFNESFAILSELMLIDGLEIDEKNTFTPKEKEDLKKVFELHRQKYITQKLEDDFDSKYTQWDERMLFIKVYQRFGVEGVLEFFNNLDFEKISKINRFNPRQVDNVLSEEYKALLNMDADTLVREFSKKE